MKEKFARKRFRACSELIVMRNGEGFKKEKSCLSHKVFKEKLLSFSRCKDNGSGLESQQKLRYSGGKLKST